MEHLYDLKLADGAVVSWPGRDGDDAALRYRDCHPNGPLIVASRFHQSSWPIPGIPNIIEPGHPLYGKSERKRDHDD